MTSSFLVLFVGVSCLVTLSHGVALTDANRDLLVNLHNQARDAEPATNMNHVAWDSSLESEAQTWTDGCNFAHQSGQSWGENLSAKTNGANVTARLVDMFQLWMDEMQFNPGGTFSECCSQSSWKCCHYTQVIWAKSTSIGCGLTLCDTLTTYSGSMSNALYLACYYSPAGNRPVSTCTWDWSPYQ